MRDPQRFATDWAATTTKGRTRYRRLYRTLRRYGTAKSRGYLDRLDAKDYVAAILHVDINRPLLEVEE